MKRKDHKHNATRWRYCVSLPLVSGSSLYRRVEQLVARVAHNHEVGGSTPPPAIMGSTSEVWGSGGIGRRRGMG